MWTYSTNNIKWINRKDFEIAKYLSLSLEDSGLLLKKFSETIQNKAKGQKGRFLVVTYWVH